MTLTAQTNVFSNTWKTIFNFLNENLTNPKPGRRKWVFSSFPDILSRESRQLSQDVFPSVIVNPIVTSATKYSMGYGRREHTFSIRVDVLAAGSAANADIDTVSDDVYDELMKGRAKLAASGINLLDLTGVNTDVLDVSEQLRVHQRTMMFEAKALI